MKYFLISLKVIATALVVVALSNCASKQQAEEVVIVMESNQSSRLVITGSRLKRAETEIPVPPPVNAEELNSVTLSNELLRTMHLTPQASHQIFKRYRVNPTIQTANNPVSTFSMDVDNGSFKLASAMLQKNELPNPDGIRIEEFVNSMNYQYSQSDQLFSISAEAMPSPFRPGYHILHIGLQTKTLSDSERNPSNLVMVADVSGSMASDSKLELLKDAMTTLVSQLNQHDQIALVVYNDNATVVLEPTRVTNKRKIFKAINRLQSGGSTNAEQGLLRGYELAEKMYQPGFNNRVILTSDGMANVGSTSPELILSKIAESKNKGIFLTTLGVGVGMYNDHLLEQLANQGNGNYLYIANQQDIQSAFVDEISSQLQTVAKDAKIQLKFNSDAVTSYRLLGYENRHLNEQDFTDPNKDGGEIGAGHKVTALYEIKLSSLYADNIGSLSIAYKKPQGNKVFVVDKNIPSSIIRSNISAASADSRLSITVAAFAEKLRQSYWARTYDYSQIEQQLNNLPLAYQQQTQVINLHQLIQQAQHLDTRSDPYETHSPIANMNFDRVPLLD